MSIWEKLFGALIPSGFVFAMWLLFIARVRRDRHELKIDDDRLW